jgi:hypothetical protein
VAVSEVQEIEMDGSLIPIWQKYNLTIPEAASYFNIGENKLRKFLEKNSDADFLLKSGNRTLIKRKKFEQLIDEIDVV